VEQLGLGRRKQPEGYNPQPSESACFPPTQTALLVGQTMIGWRTHDVIRAIDYLSTRQEIDPKRIAVMGVSGGGTTALFAAALDERIKCAVVSGYFNTFQDLFTNYKHCICNMVPGILQVCEMYDIAGLVAPRYLLCETGTGDWRHPVAAARGSFQKARRVYQQFGARENIRLEVFEGGHRFWGKAAFAFLKQVL